MTEMCSWHPSKHKNICIAFVHCWSKVQMLYKSVVFAGIEFNNFPVVQACQEFFAYKYAKLFLIVVCDSP